MKEGVLPLFGKELSKLMQLTIHPDQNMSVGLAERLKW
jgi:hypothetical protein